MGKKIEANEYDLSKIFSSEFEFHIPPYQRPYSWTKDEVSVLFDDLYDFYTNEKDDNYFLGSIVLIKNDNDPQADIIDGQQRLTSLSLLLSSIASRMVNSKEEEELKKDLKEYLIEPGKKLEGLSSKPRLTLRKKDNDFFKKYIQEIDINELLKLDTTKLNEPQKHIVENVDVFTKKIDQLFFDDRKQFVEFATFLLKRCYLVVVSTSSQDSAFRIFSVMNNRGLPLLATDIIKSEVIGKIVSEKQEEYTSIWENLEEKVGRDDFNNLFSYIRMIFGKSKAKKNLLDEFRISVLFQFENNPEEFINNILIPYADSYYLIKNEAYESSSRSKEINYLLKWMNKFDNSDWISPTILVFAEYANDSDYIFEYLKKLERLSAYMYISSKDINFRISRYAKIISQIQAYEDLSELDLTLEEREDFKEKLNGDIYTMVAKRRNYFILRLDSFVSDLAAEYNPKILTIEHVLPQTIKKGSEWENIWFNGLDQDSIIELHNKWLHKFGNLVPLTRQKNSAAQNFDFDMKKEKYFTGKSGTSSYALTTHVLNKKEWSPSVVEERQKEILDIFIKEWLL